MHLNWAKICIPEGVNKVTHLSKTIENFEQCDEDMADTDDKMMEEILGSRIRIKDRGENR